MARVVFFCHDTRANIDSFEYYKQDIESLQALGHEVIVCTKVVEIPFRYDAMFIWWWTHALTPILLSRAAGRPAVVTGVFNFRAPKGFKRGDYFRRPLWQRALVSAAARWCDLNLFIDETELHQCTEYFGLQNAQFFPCTVHHDYLQGPGNRRELSIFNLAWSGHGNLLRKGIPDLFKALRILKDQRFEITLYQAGHRGDEAHLLDKWVDELEIRDRVQLLGSLQRAEKIEFLRRCEIYAQPSHYEGFGLATAEAMGSGACVVTCDVGAVRSVVGDCGLYVRPGSPEELAAGIRRVAENSQLRASLQDAAVRRARERFAAEGKRERLRNCLRKVGIG